MRMVYFIEFPILVDILCRSQLILLKSTVSLSSTNLQKKASKSKCNACRSHAWKHDQISPRAQLQVIQLSRSLFIVEEHEFPISTPLEQKPLDRNAMHVGPMHESMTKYPSVTSYSTIPIVIYG